MIPFFFKVHGKSRSVFFRCTDFSPFYGKNYRIMKWKITGIVRKTRRLWNTSEETLHVWHKAPLRTWCTIPRRSTLANSCHRTVLNIPLFAQAAWNSQRKDNRDNKWKEFSVQVRMDNACRLINACLFSTERPSLQYPSITPHICWSIFLGWFILENKSPPILLLSQLLMDINTSLYPQITTVQLVY